MRIDGSVKPPVVIQKVDPVTTPEGHKGKKFSGDAVIHFWVDEDGNTSHVSVVNSARKDLDEEAVEAIKQYKFKPATKKGKPVTVDLYMNVHFEIF